MTDTSAPIVVIDGRAAPDWAPSITEPAAQPAMTLEQIRGLLQDATALAAAQRPVILRGPEAPTPAPQTGHPGIHVTYPSVAAEQAQPGPARRLYTRAELVFACGAFGTVSTLTAGIASAVTSSPAPLAVAAVGGILASVGAAVVMTNDDDRAQLKSWRENRRGGR